MAVEILPAVLATTTTQLSRRVAVAERLASIIHLDVMDGKFVQTKSVGMSVLGRTRWRRKIEIHAMVNNPVSILPLLDAIKPQRVYLHVETGKSLWPMIAFLRSRRIEFGLAINPSTRITALQPFVPYIKSVLVMSVKPGTYHAPLWAGAFQRIKKIHRRWPKMLIAVDGAMNTVTLPQAMRVGARRIIIGSDVMLNVHPKAEWKKLKQLTN